jgi:hypothetical protein
MKIVHRSFLIFALGKYLEKPDSADGSANEI